MFLRFSVLSRSKAKAFTFKQNIDDCAIISISDVNSPENHFCSNPHIKGICYLRFDDVEFGDINCITEKDALKIVQFVNAMKNKVDLFIVHCEAGVSRSAGVCAAIMTMLEKDDMEIFNNEHFCPNISCYKAVLTAAGKELDEKEIHRKEKHNIQIWCKANDIEPQFPWRDEDEEVLNFEPEIE